MGVKNGMSETMRNGEVIHIILAIESSLIFWAQKSFLLQMPGVWHLALLLKNLKITAITQL